MHLMQQLRFRRIAVLATVLAVVTVAACVDEPTRPASQASSATSDFVAAGMLYNALFVRTDTGLELARLGSSPLEIRAAGGQVRTSLADIASSPSPVLRARFSSATSSAFTLSPPAAPRAASAHVLRTRRVATRRMDGKVVTVAVAPDDDRKSGRPPKATLILVDDRIAAITEYRYARKAGAWRVARVRTTFVDSAGSITLVTESDMSELVYRAGASPVGILDRTRKAAQVMRAGLASIALPDVLHAASPSRVEEPCWQEGLAFAAASTALLGAGAGVTIAQAAEAAARTASAAAVLSCAADPLTCGAVPIAAAALIAAEVGVTRAWTLLASALAASAATQLAWTECLRRVIDPDPSGGGEESDNPECEEWCEWTVSFSGGRIDMQRNYCWCEYGDAAT